MSLEKNLKEITQKIETAKNNSKRCKSEVALIAVSKTETDDTIKEFYKLGQRHFGESRAQTLRDRLVSLEDLDIKWHFIGPLQRNKIKYVYGKSHLVHSIDSERLIESFIKMEERTKHICPILLQVHISGEAAKQGFPLEEIMEIIKKYRENPSLKILGLMGMAPLNATEEETKACFKVLYEIFEESKKLEGSAYEAKVLSMGMSQDFEMAIAEGANMVRIGSALFKTQE